MLGEKKELSSLIEYQKNFIIIEDNVEYKRCTVKINRQGIVLRDIVKGSHIKTKKQQVCKAGQLLVAEIDAKVGGYGIVPQNLDGAIVSSHYFLFNIDTIKLYRDYLKYFLKTDQFFSQIKAQGTTNYAAIRPKDVLITQIPLPALDEQQRIASVVDDFTVNNKVLDINIKKSKSILDQIRQSILQEAVQGKLVPQEPNDEPASELLKKIKAEKERLIKEKKIKKEKPLPPIKDEEIPYELPGGWEWCKLYDVSFVTKLAGFEYTDHFVLKGSGDVPVIRAQNVKMSRLDETNLLYIDQNTSDLLERSALTKKCILMTFIGAGIGDVAIFDKKRRYHLAPNVAKVEVFNSSEINLMEEYLLYYLMSPIGRRQVLKFLKATAQPSLSMQTIREVFIAIPPTLEQKRIVVKVDQLMRLCDELEASITQAQKDSELLMQAVLQEAFGGNKTETVEKKEILLDSRS